MNKTEAAWAEMLERRRAVGEIRQYGYEAVKLRIGARCFYAPDFLVVTAGGALELHEVKGHMEDDALVKMRACRSLYPFLPLKIVRRAKGGWDEEWLA